MNVFVAAITPAVCRRCRRLAAPGIDHIRYLESLTYN